MIDGSLQFFDVYVRFYFSSINIPDPHKFLCDLKKIVGDGQETIEYDPEAGPSAPPFVMLFRPHEFNISLGNYDGNDFCDFNFQRKSLGVETGEGLKEVFVPLLRRMYAEIFADRSRFEIKALRTMLSFEMEHPDVWREEWFADYSKTIRIPGHVDWIKIKDERLQIIDREIEIRQAGIINRFKDRDGREILMLYFKMSHAPLPAGTFKWDGPTVMEFMTRAIERNELWLAEVAGIMSEEK